MREKERFVYLVVGAADGGMVTVTGKGDYPSAGMAVAELAGDFGAWDKNGHRVK